MPIFIQNSLTKKKEEFVPLAPREVRMYTCGVTVYDDCHVGHARSLFIFDVIRRYLTYLGYRVHLVRNITDIDDKIINRARQERVPFEEIRGRYIKHYYRDLEALEIERADFEPMATENIHDMIEHIKHLIAKGVAYEVEGDVYFSVRSFAPYGHLSGQGLDEMMTAVRIERDEKKRDTLDFALWKKSKEGEPSWPSPWGLGRPGWHIECSAMSMRYLKSETLDIHAGGRDLVFPHHENEIAQSEALTGKRFANYWIHHGLLTIEGRKMSKSLGNFVTIQEALAKYPPDILKLFFLSAHYASPMDFSFAALEKAKKGYEKIVEFLDKASALKQQHEPGSVSAASDVTVRELAGMKQRFLDAMDDDFNTAKGGAVLFDLLTLGNRYLAVGKEVSSVVAVEELLLELSGVFGMRPKASGNCLSSSMVRLKVAGGASTLSASEVEQLIGERRQARRLKNFKRADEIREFLKTRGIFVEDMEKAQ